MIGEWAGPPGATAVALRNDLVPADLQADLQADRFIATLIDRVLERTPIDMHVDVRAARDHRAFPIQEADEAADADAEDQDGATAAPPPVPPGS